MSCTTFQVVYDGHGLQDSTMDVNQLAPALLALGKVMEEANYSLNDSRTKVSLRVKASFQSGCFGIDFDVVQGLLDQTLNIFKESQVASAKEIVEYLGFISGSAIATRTGLIQLIFWLKGRTIKEVILFDDGTVQVVVDGDIFKTELKTIELYRNFKLRAALEKAIIDPLEKNGIDSVAFTTDPSKGFFTITKEQRHWFKSPNQETLLLGDSESITNLQLVSISFKDDNKWRFTEGGMPFHAKISHYEFLNRVQQSEESFTAGDLLRVRLKKTQWLAGETIKSDYEVLEVIGHKKAAIQLTVPFRDAE
ncbi:MAG: hypothetical protein ACXW1W_13370 [Methylococcaceae bacterium]